MQAPKFLASIHYVNYARRMTSFPAPRMVDAGGVNLAVYEADGDPERKNPPVVLIHGWPEIAFSWANQINVLAGAGYRVIAPDLKGFGRSDAPKDPAHYDAAHMTGDFAAMLDALEIGSAVFCGHDWGGALIWSMGQLRPERVTALIGVCTPLRPRPPAPPLSIIEKRFTPKHYFIQFQERGVPEKLFESDPDRFFHMMFRKPVSRDRWPDLIPSVYDLPGRFREGKMPSKEGLLVSEDVIEVYVDAYRRSGFTGGINLYRNVNRNWELMEGRDQTIKAPSLWIGAELDLFLPPESAEGMDDLVPDLEKHIIPGSGHWVMWEKPEELNAILIDWLKRRISI
jgi:pimeloyl-ACP methyl ester carboxylesterase